MVTDHQNSQAEEFWMDETLNIRTEGSLRLNLNSPILLLRKLCFFSLVDKLYIKKFSLLNIMTEGQFVYVYLLYD